MSNEIGGRRASKGSSLPRDRQLLTRVDVADELGLSVRKIDELLAARELPHIKIGRSVRIRPVDLTAWLQAQVVGR